MDQTWAQQPKPYNKRKTRSPAVKLSRPPIPQILFHLVFPSLHPHVHVGSSSNCPLQKDNQQAECLSPPSITLQEPPDPDDSSPLPPKCPFCLLYFLLSGSTASDCMYHKSFSSRVKCGHRILRFAGGRTSARRSFIFRWGWWCIYVHTISVLPPILTSSVCASTLA